jgi:hypothetical protein
MERSPWGSKLERLHAQQLLPSKKKKTGEMFRVP